MARPGVRYSIDNPLTSHTHNVISTLNLLKASLENDIEYFVNASSSSVYGEPLSLPYDESHPTKPISPYGVSKLTAEHYTRCFYEIYGLPTVSLRYFTVYGPRMRPDLAIFSFLRKIISGNPPIIYGTGEQKRDFTYVEDIVQANLQALAIRPKGEIFNIGSGKTISINDIFQILIDITGSTLEPRYEERVIGDVSDTWANIEKAKKILGWKPKTEIADGLKAFADWYMQSKHFYDQLHF